jgi:murein DD-endopeptidase MepM/ murein hydrolase activator NlpD
MSGLRGSGGQGAGVLFAALLLLLAGCNFSGRPSQEPPKAASPAVAEPAPAASGQGPGAYSAFPGDTVYGVAQRFGVPVRTLIETNGLKPPYRLVAGQRLQVPERQEHVVQSGDTLLAISRIYGVDQSSLARVNNLKPPYALKAGQRLTLPGRIDANLAAGPPEQQDIYAAPTAPNAGTGGSMSVEQLPAPATQQAPKQQPPKQQAVEPPAAAPSTSGTVEPSTSETVEPVAPQQPAPKATTPKQTDTQVAAIPPEPAPAPRAGERFLWPVKGQIISGFGPKKGGLNNDGINISAPAGTSVMAADNGVVAYAGNELRGFGNLLLIRHADGWVTAYAHNEKLLVKRGEKVKRGQAIAQIGSTGNVSAPQLHFEIRKGTDPVDPLKYLGS